MEKQAISQITAAVNEGEYAGLQILLMDYTMGNRVVDKNPTLALTYRLALEKILPGPPYTEKYFPRDPSLTAEQVAAATKTANDIAAANARRHLKRP